MPPSAARRLALASALAVAAAGAAPEVGSARALPSDAASIVALLDFEDVALGDVLRASGDVTARRAAVPAFRAGVDERPPPGVPAPTGKGLLVRSGPGGFLHTAAGVVPTDWSGVERFGLWIHRSPAEASARSTSTIEVQLVESGEARFRRRVVLDHAGWHFVEVELRTMAWQQTRVPRTDRIASVGVLFRDATELAIDGVVAIDEPDGPGAYLPGEEFRALAFPGVAPEKVVVERRSGDEPLEVWALADTVDVVAIADRMERVARDLAPLLPDRGDPHRVPRLVVLPTDASYRAFAPRFAEAYASVAAAPRSDGFTLLAVAQGAFDPAQGDRRPTFVHEFVHAWASSRGLLANTSEWLQEGLATLAQLREHPQDGFARLVANGLAHDPLPLAELANGEPIGVERYWQAMTLVETLIERPKYAGRFPKLVAGVQALGSTDLEPFLGGVFDTTFEELEQEWRAHCAETYLGATETGEDR
ncbi:MAG: hypothetical protein R3F34_06810 [Planctomycetota bacterium]